MYQIKDADMMSMIKAIDRAIERETDLCKNGDYVELAGVGYGTIKFIQHVLQETINR